MTALALAAAELRRVTRDRTFLFFLVVLPILVILLVGLTTASSTNIRVAVVPGQPTPLATQLVHDLEASNALKTQRFTTRAQGVAALRRGEVEAVVVVPMTLDADLRAGATTRIPVLVSGAVQSSQAAVTAVSSIVAGQGATVQAAKFATTHSTRSFQQNLAMTRSLQRETPVVPVRTQVVNSKSNFLPLGYNYSAPTMLVLFVFINALAGGAAMIQAHRFGIFARALAAPVRARDLVLGETLCYLTLALGQALLIVVVGAVMFGVSWGNPWPLPCSSGCGPRWGPVPEWSAALTSARPSRQRRSALRWASPSGCWVGVCGHSRSSPSLCACSVTPRPMRGRWTPG